MRRVVGIYIIDKTIYFKPYSQLKNGPLIMNGNEITIGTSDDEIEIGQCLINSFELCCELNEKPQEDYYKQFLKSSKVRSSINLLRVSKFIKATLSKNTLKLIKVEADINKKAFCKESKIPKQELNLENVNNEELGKILIQMNK